jgi:ferric-dicitrate binding protein FerR (iron transport regulator)
MASTRVDRLEERMVQRMAWAILLELARKSIDAGDMRRLSRRRGSARRRNRNRALALGVCAAGATGVGLGVKRWHRSDDSFGETARPS